MIGRKLSQFEIVAKLGEGGMGVVYRARDTKLGRDVAIKVLPEELTADPERMARFEREARVLASLNHPSIAAIHDLKEADGNHFLVLELVEGEDLLTVLRRGSLAIPKALHIALQLADALETTHNLGVVHRDLKPANIMVGPNDQIKVLDFGLAKPADGGGTDDPDLTHSPTRTAPMTQAGLILGTAGYMSPEQARGQPVDKQADIWAFGVVLWEMLTGTPLIRGESIADMMVAVLKAEVDWGALPENTPVGIRRLLRRCLEREPRQRLHSMGDARLEIEAAMEGDEETVAVGVETVVAPAWSRALAAAAVTGLVALVWVLARPAPEAPKVFRSQITLPDNSEPFWVAQGAIQLSPDGSRVLYQARVVERSLVIRDFATGEFTSVPGTEGATYPFWSPDGESIAFFADSQLRRISLDGSNLRVLADAPTGRGGSWSSDGTIIFAPEIRSPLMAVSEDGGTPRPVTDHPGENFTHRNPFFLPDGRQFLFTLKDREDPERGGRIAVGSTESDLHVEITDRASNPQFSGGHLFFVRDRILMAQPFDLRALETTGPIHPLAEAVEYQDGRSIGNYSVSGGVLAYHQDYMPRVQLAWFNTDSQLLETVGEPVTLQHAPSVDDEISQVALQVWDQTELYQDLWVMDLERGTMTRATSFSAAEVVAAFSSDGKRLVLGSSATSAERSGVWLQSASGAGPIERVHDSAGFSPTDWSNDGRYVLGFGNNEATGIDVLYIDLEGDRELRPLFDGRFNEMSPRLSPDDKWLAFVSDETGRAELYVTDFPAARTRWLVSRAVGSETRNLVRRWGRDGRTLYYNDHQGVFQVSFESGDPPTIGEPQMIAPNAPPSANIAGRLAVVDDRALVLRYPSEPVIEPIQLVLNWQRLVEDP